jgi:hypothetical protein
MLDLKTPLSKCTRVSRKVDVANFLAVPGVWVKINNDGSAANVVTSAAPAVAKLCIGTASANQYESHDVEVGRITTLETIGARASVDADGFSGTYANPGDYLSVDPTSGNEGKLKEAVNGETIVAVTEGYDAVTGILTYIIADPTICPASITTPAPTTTAAPTTTTTAAPTTTTAAP